MTVADHISPLVAAELTALRELIAQTDRRHTERAQTDTETRNTALSGINDRLNQGNEYRSQLRDQAGKFFTRDEHAIFAKSIVASFEMRDQRREGELSRINDNLNERAKTNWPALISLAGILAVMAGGGFSVMGLKIESAISPVVLGLEQVKISSVSNTTRLAAVEEADARTNAAVAEIRGIKENYTLLTERNATMRADIAKQGAALVDIEGQFCASDIVRNLMHTSDLRLVAMIWRKTFDTPLPTDNAYYPQICRK